jgi:pimeloyl-ACP methyl ester carboxylesterase
VRGIEGWWSQGERILITLGEAERTIFVRRLGAGPSMTLLHGFPSCSYDWAGVAGALAERYSLLLPDLLGFGASDKPTDHDYSIHEQADLVEALWARAGVTRRSSSRTTTRSR